MGIEGTYLERRCALNGAPSPGNIPGSEPRGTYEVRADSVAALGRAVEDTTEEVRDALQAAGVSTADDLLGSLLADHNNGNTPAGPVTVEVYDTAIGVYRPEARNGDGGAVNGDGPAVYVAPRDSRR